MAGIAGFVNGVFTGMDWREGRDDRKRVRAMQDEEFGWRREDQEWQREDRVFTRSERARAERERAKAEADRATEERLWNEYADSEYGAVDGETAPATTPNPGRNPEDVLMTQGGLGFGVLDEAPAPAVTKSAKDAPARPAPQGRTAPDTPPAAALGQTGASTDAPKDATEGFDLRREVEKAVAPQAARAEAGNAAPAAPQQASPAAPAYAGPVAGRPGVPGQLPAAPPPPQNSPVAGRPGVPGQLPAARRELSILEQAAEQSMPQAARDRFNRSEPTPPQAVPLQIGAAPDAGGAGVLERASQSSMPQEARNRLNGPAVPTPPPVRGMMPTNPVTDGPMAPPRAEDASLPPAAPKAPARTGSAPAPVPQTDKGTPMESVSTLIETGERLSFGVVDESGKVSGKPRDVSRVAEASVKAYRNEKVPAILEHYVRTGQIEKAQAFEKWIEDKGVQEGMKSWAKAIHSFQVGDGDGFLDAMADAYEANNYYDDGLSIVREDSSLTRDDAGNIVGARITFKDDATGETFTQNVSDVRDVVASAIGIMAPEKAFELAWDQTFGRDKAAEKPDVVSREEAIKIVNEEDKERPLAGLPPMTPEEKQARFDAITGGSNPFAGGAASGVGAQIPLYR